MSKGTQNVLILHGDDSYTIDSAVQEMVQKARAAGQDGIADMNIIHLDGKTSGFGEIESAVMTLPFFGGKRLVILNHFMQIRKSKEKGFQKQFLEMLDAIPETTVLMIIIEDEFISKRRGWDFYEGKFWLKKWAESEINDHCLAKTCQLPSDREMPRWIEKHARELDGKISPRAASELAALVGSDTWQAHQELNKLLTFVNFARLIEPDDVQELVTYGGQTDIFQLVDDMAEGRTKQAQHMLHMLLEQDSPNAIFPMIVRQFRLLTMAREVLDEGGSEGDIASKMKQHPYVAGKLNRQARLFSKTQLNQIYHHLLKIDEETKSSGMPLDVSMDLLLFEIQSFAKSH
ncbi:MAG: DNA polymerase III subunit delta [Anaerolineaceae bacterium]|nr:DNA polymerase III subunit delta [Anaerolineaceae bacterium]